MSAPVILALGTLGGLASIARALVDRAVMRRVTSAFPYGTLAVNLSSAFALGVLAGAALSGDAYRLAGVGVLGAYTTFSTWMLETDRLARAGQRRAAVANVVVSLVLGVVRYGSGAGSARR